MSAESPLRSLRLIAPVYSSAGMQYGILVANINVGYILDAISMDSRRYYNTYITNDQGVILSGTGLKRTPGRIPGRRYLEQQGKSAVASTFSVPLKQTGFNPDSQSFVQDNLTIMRKVYIDPMQRRRFVALIRSAPRNVVLGASTGPFQQGYYIAIVLAVVSAILAALSTRLLTRPIRQMTLAAKQVWPGRQDTPFPHGSDDEIGVLSRTLKESMDDIRRKGTELLQSESRLKMTIDTAVNGIVSINEYGVIDSVNKAMEKMFGYQEQEMLGENVSLLMPASYAREHDSNIRNYIKTGDKKVIGKLRELVAKRKDGSIFPILLAVNESVIQGKRQFVGVIQDMSVLKSTEERTRRLGRILESSSNEILVFDSQSHALIEYNHAVCNNLGYSQEELGKMTIFDLIPENELEHVTKVLTVLDGSSSDEQQLDTLFKRRNGSLYPVEIRMFSCTSNTGDVGIFIAQDISEHQRQLESLKDYTRRLKSSNKELRDFAFVASHDLQEPLRKVQAFGDRLMANDGNNLSRRGIDYVGRMQNAAARMQTLINDLLTLSRVTSKGKAFVDVDLSDVAHEVIEDLEACINDTEARVNLGMLPTVKADPTQMRQLLQNLIGNGLKFSKDGEVPNVNINSSYIDMTADKPAHHIVTVEDNGIGFDNKYAERIFTPFERLHSRQQYDGTGMGLAVCRKIVERHGGVISADSQPGKGSTFTVVLPVVTGV
jgi:two-component system sensor kinase FixL